MTMSALDETNVSPGYRALIEAVGVVDMTGRTQLELSGDDRATFLHNFCTNNIRNLPVGSGAEAFILDAKGHCLGHVYVFCGPASIILDTAPGQAEKLTQHLDRYILRDDVEIHDRTSTRGQLLVAGPQAKALMESLALSVPHERMAHGESTLMSRSAYLRRMDLVGPDTWLLACRREDTDTILSALANAGAVRGGPEAFEMARIEAGTPLYGRDITEKNLPQEVNRDQFAISFTKGCYLGQETVARIDALGHVNKVLVGVRFSTPDVPAAGEDLKSVDNGDSSDASTVGAVTSAVFSPRLQTALALAYLRRGHSSAGTKVNSSVGIGEVVTLPL
jgi:folate-binding protein YgfZ